MNFQVTIISVKRVEQGEMVSDFCLLFPVSTLQTGFVLAVAEGFVLEPAFSGGNASQLPKPGCLSPRVQTALRAFGRICHTVMAMHSQFRASAGG